MEHHLPAALVLGQLAWFLGSFIAIGVGVAAAFGAICPRALERRDEDWGDRQW